MSQFLPRTWGGKKATVPCYLHVGLNCCAKFHVTPIAFVWKTIRTKLTSSGWMRINQHASASAVAAEQMWLKQSKFTGIILPCQRSARDIERCYIVSCQCMLTAALTKKRDASSKKATPPREGSESREKKEKKNTTRATAVGAPWQEITCHICELMRCSQSEIDML